MPSAVREAALSFRRLLHSHRLGKVSRLIHVTAAANGDIVRQQLQRNAGQNRGQQVERHRNGKGGVGQTLNLSVAIVFECTASRGAMNTTGMFSSIKAIGPCFISAAGYPSAWM